MQIQKEVLFLPTSLFILFAQLTEDFTLIWTMFISIKIRGKFIYNTSDGDSFQGQGHYISK